MFLTLTTKVALSSSAAAGLIAGGSYIVATNVDSIAHSLSKKVEFEFVDTNNDNVKKIDRLTASIASVNGSLVDKQGLLQQANSNLEVTIGQITKTRADIISHGKNLEEITKTLPECESKLTTTEVALKLALDKKTAADRVVSLRVPIVFSYSQQLIIAQTNKTQHDRAVLDAQTLYNSFAQPTSTSARDSYNKLQALQAKTTAIHSKHTDAARIEKIEKDNLDRFINTAHEKEAEYSAADKIHNAASEATLVAKANKANLQKEKTQKESNLSTLLRLKDKKDAEIASLRSTIESLSTQLATLNNKLVQAKLSSGQ